MGLETELPRFQKSAVLRPVRIVDVLLLVCGEVRRSKFAVAGCLIQQRDEVAVFQNILNLGKKVLHILVAPVGTAPFAERFQISALYAAVCSSFSKVELVCKIP